jgi:hypothetical protein
MKTTLGRNVPNGKYASVIEIEDKKIYLTCYKQKNGWSSLNKIVSQIELDDDRMDLIIKQYKLFSRMKTNL